MNTPTERPYRLPGHIVLPEPRLRFGSKNASDLDIHPMRGLLRFGPFSKDKLSAVPNPIRVAIIAPAGQTNRVINLLCELERSHQPRERRLYLPAFPGFEKVFGIRLAQGGPATSIEPPTFLSKWRARLSLMSPSPRR